MKKRIECFATEGYSNKVGAIWQLSGMTFVRTPAGVADITTWVITGEIPRLTASPSIWVRAPEWHSDGSVSEHSWHGWLRDGFLEEC